MMLVTAFVTALHTTYETHFVARPEPEPEPVLISYVWSVVGPKELPPFASLGCHRRTAEANSLPRTNQLKSTNRPQTARAVGEA